MPKWQKRTHEGGGPVPTFEESTVTATRRRQERMRSLLESYTRDFAEARGRHYTTATRQSRAKTIQKKRGEYYTDPECDIKWNIRPLTRSDAVIFGPQLSSKIIYDTANKIQKNADKCIQCFWMPLYHLNMSLAKKNQPKYHTTVHAKQVTALHAKQELRRRIRILRNILIEDMLVSAGQPAPERPNEELDQTQTLPDSAIRAVASPDIILVSTLEDFGFCWNRIRALFERVAEKWGITEIFTKKMNEQLEGPASVFRDAFRAMNIAEAKMIGVDLTKLEKPLQEFGAAMEM